MGPGSAAASRLWPERQSRRESRIIASVIAAAVLALMQPDTSWAQQQGAPAPETPAAWRVECTGDGKSLECRAIQQIFQMPSRQLVASVAARFAPETKAGQLSILLPLGLNLTEPVLVKVDNGPPERQPIQTCNNAGCLVTMAAPDKLLAAMRTGTDLKLTVQDASKKPIELSLPLLGFGIAYDKTK
jgi:invasion protein IalB